MAGRAQINLWAMMIALTSCWLNIAGGFICFFYPGGLVVAIYGISVGAIGALFWWPCKFMGPMLLLFQFNFFFSGIVCLGLSVLSFFQVPTTLAAISLVIAGILYIIAGIRKEKGSTLAQLTGGPR